MKKASVSAVGKGPGFEILEESWTLFKLGKYELAVRATLMHSMQQGEKGELQAAQQVVAYAPPELRGFPRPATKIEETFEAPTPSSVGSSRYRLTNGAVIEIKTDLSRVARLDGFNEGGMPIFNIQAGQAIDTLEKPKK